MQKYALARAFPLGTRELGAAAQSEAVRCGAYSDIREHEHDQCRPRAVVTGYSGTAVDEGLPHCCHRDGRRHTRMRSGGPVVNASSFNASLRALRGAPELQGDNQRLRRHGMPQGLALERWRERKRRCLCGAVYLRDPKRARNNCAQRQRAGTAEPKDGDGVYPGRDAARTLSASSKMPGAVWSR